MAAYANETVVYLTHSIFSMVHLRALPTNEDSMIQTNLHRYKSHFQRAHLVSPNKCFLFRKISQALQTENRKKNKNKNKPTPNLSIRRAIKIHRKLNPLIWIKIRGLSTRDISSCLAAASTFSKLQHTSQTSFTLSEPDARCGEADTSKLIKNHYGRSSHGSKRKTNRNQHETCKRQ